MLTPDCSGVNPGGGLWVQYLVPGFKLAPAVCKKLNYCATSPAPNIKHCFFFNLYVFSVVLKIKPGPPRHKSCVQSAEFVF